MSCGGSRFGAGPGIFKPILHRLPQRKDKTAGLMLDKLDLEHVGDNAEAWEKVVRKLRTGMMPPSGARRPEGR